jgi:hypothetical protein
MKQPLAIVRGTTKTMTIRVTAEDGSVYTLGSGEILRFGVKKHPGDTAYLFSKDMSSSSLADGVYSFIINPGDTENLDFGCYYYDVGLQSGSEYFNVIPCSDFRVEYNVTKREVSNA